MKLSYLAPMTIGFALAMLLNSYVFQTDYCSQKLSEDAQLIPAKKADDKEVFISKILLKKQSEFTDDHNNATSEVPESTCVSMEELEQLDGEWSESIGSPYDPDGRLLPENEYITGLEISQIEDLAAQGYAKAMAVLGIKLLKSKKPTEIKRGRDWAYKAAVNGIVSPLTDLAVSYLNEYQQFRQTNDSKASTTAIIKYESTLRLFEYLAPGSTSGLMGAVPMTEAQVIKVDEDTATLIDNYNQQREQLGLGELSIAIPNTTNAAEFIVCEDYFASTKYNDL